MSDDIVEIVAHRLHAKHLREVNHWDWRNFTETEIRGKIEANWPYAKKDFLQQARAALAAIQETHAVVPREPTKRMIEAGEWDDGDPHYGQYITGSMAEDCWHRMIAASDAP